MYMVSSPFISCNKIYSPFLILRFVILRFLCSVVLLFVLPHFCGSVFFCSSVLLFAFFLQRNTNTQHGLVIELIPGVVV